VRNNPLSYTDPSGFLEEVVVYAKRSGGCSAGATCYSGGSFSFFDASAAAMHDLSNMAVGGLYDAVSNAVERVEFAALVVGAGIGMLTEQEDTDAPLDDPKDQEARKAENKQKQKDALNAKSSNSSSNFPEDPNNDKDKDLSKQDQKSIRSLEKQIKKHEQKIKDFKKNPTVRPGMENQPKDVIKAQQQKRIEHLQKEINTFNNNINKIRQGKM